MAKKILLMLLLLSAGNVKAVQLCDCHVMCEAINQLDHYKANKQHFKFLKLADRGWFFRSEVDLGSFEEFDQKGYKKFTELLKFLKAKNVRFSIVNLPPRLLLNPGIVSSERYENVLSRFNQRQNQWRALDALVPDWNLVFKGESSSPYYFSRDTRWTPEGAKLTATMLANSIAWRGAAEFTTTRGGIERLKGDMQSFVESICPAKYPFEYYRKYTTTGVPESETSAPEVLLIGSANSDEKLNFGGFLAEALSARVKTLTAKNVDLYDLSSLTSEQMPEWVIFEIPAEVTFKNSSVYAQLASVKFKQCDAPVLSGVAKIPGNNTDVLFNIESKKIDPASHYVYISTATPGAIIGKLRFWYPAGYMKEVDVNGRNLNAVAVDLPNLSDWERRTLVAVDYYSENATVSELKIDLCPANQL